jgi:hypothetical protein
MKLQDAISVEFNIVVYGDLFSGLSPDIRRNKSMFMGMGDP